MSWTRASLGERFSNVNLAPGSSEAPAQEVLELRAGTQDSLPSLAVSGPDQGQARPHVLPAQRGCLDPRAQQWWGCIPGLRDSQLVPRWGILDQPPKNKVSSPTSWAWRVWLTSWSVQNHTFTSCYPSSCKKERKIKGGCTLNCTLEDHLHPFSLVFCFSFHQVVFDLVRVLYHFVTRVL